MADKPRKIRKGRAGRSASRFDTVLRLLNPHRFGESLELGAQPSLRNATLAGLQAAIAVAVCVPLLELSPWSHLVGFAALGSLVALFGRFAPQYHRSGIVLKCVFWQTVAVFSMSATAWLGWSQTAQLALLAFACGFYLLVCFNAKFGAPGPLIFIFAVGASITDTLSLEQVMERTLATAAAALFAWLICVASEKLRDFPTAERPFPTVPDQSVSYLLFMSARVALAAFIVVFLSHACGLQYPAWAAMGAVAVMQGSHLHINMHRALQRTLGTIVGAMLAWLLLAQQPSIWPLIIVLVLLQFLIEVVIGINYALGQVLVTPMALLMTHLAAPASAGASMVPERVIDTLLGAIVGMVISIVLSNIEDRQMLERYHRSRMRR
ncbi:Fusaric acid resistance protein-like [Methylobacillus rhizosphaerae]|uniref:Fusaric acid resistance protein-like n=1 Tax=Methylobacillus rhizosphaerae TaxID=551994 RepID=A0A238YE78_9PROT|nr:FUSC family protein [Methylobacillus rhizosphaerae]SNR69088.1 Fusaric acid resistance protein-like [Methylobacillus rhizosphaerae]